MSEKEIEALQKNARRWNRAASALFAVAWLGLTAALLAFSLYVSAQEGISLQLELIAASVTLPLVAAFGLYLLLYFLFVRWHYDRFNRAFKEKYVLQTLQAAGGFESLRYDPSRGFSYQEVWDSCVVATGEQKYFKSEDLLLGSFQGMPFAYCDVVTESLRRRGKRSRVETIFEGQILRFSLPEGSKWSFGHLQIFEKELLSNLKGRTAPHKIQVEHEGFNRRFQVFAADEHNAFYLLTPQMLEQIVQFADAAGCQTALTFVGPYLYVAMNSRRSMFDASVKEPFDKQRQAILADAGLMRRAGELLVLEADLLAQRERT